MAVYKVPQDIEADDKLIGWMSLKQFIFGVIAVVGVAIMYFAFVRGVAWLAIPFLPFTILAGILAAPIGKDQPTEIWLAARIRFFLKPHRRIWDQSGMKKLVTITAPPHDEHKYTNGLDQDQVRSRLEALARTLDSRGWAVRNVSVNLFSRPAFATPMESPDRLMGPTAYMQQQIAVSSPVGARDDIFDEQSNPLARSLDNRLQESRMELRQNAVQKARGTPPYGGQSIAPHQAPFLVSVPGREMEPADGTLLSEFDAMTEQAAAEFMAQRRAAKEDFENNMPEVIGHDSRRKKFRRNENLPTDSVQTNLQNLDQKTSTPPTPEHDIVKLANTDDVSIAAVSEIARHAADGTLGGNEVVIKLR